MTESAGFATVTPSGASPEDVAGQVGEAGIGVTVTVRAPMRDDGLAGKQLPDGEIGELCYEGPTVFVGYYGLEEETAKTLSKDGVLYTGDTVYIVEKQRPVVNGKRTGVNPDSDTYRAFCFKGRRKFIIRTKGYNVHPGDVENAILDLDGVAEAEVVGVHHKLFDEAVFAYVKIKPSSGITEKDIYEHCKNGLSAYSRPHHVVIWAYDDPFPLTRVAKTDKIALQDKAKEVVEQLRTQGKWD
eukprot:NODE_572_length_865_cov_1102.731618_g436_i0.p1 GENE.NODE_572_length_865_cov_1102.731618_g436_i0~~NODE_572_length_865_cov_1102.731618_g436_i0.p1  ORF type:complete len:242 (+),score=47.29 NODE_572_length_865_cov_1102.731618_g436_i0:34-759(+)